jgi:hypothetical protein
MSQGHPTEDVVGDVIEKDAPESKTPTQIQPKIAIQVRAAVDPQMKDQRRAMSMKIPTVKAIGQIFWDHCQPSAAYLARLPAIANSISARLLIVRLIRINVLDTMALLLPTRAIADPFLSEYRPLRRRQAGRMAQAKLKTIRVRHVSIGDDGAGDATEVT